MNYDTKISEYSLLYNCIFDYLFTVLVNNKQLGNLFPTQSDSFLKKMKSLDFSSLGSVPGL
jgi:hypothetical protein